MRVISGCETTDVVTFFFNDTATTEIYTLSLHDALPICSSCGTARSPCTWRASSPDAARASRTSRSEEHTSELQSRQSLVCRPLLEQNILHGFQRRILSLDDGHHLRERRLGVDVVE